jgi:hypothetical protein
MSVLLHSITALGSVCKWMDSLLCLKHNIVSPYRASLSIVLVCVLIVYLTILSITLTISMSHEERGVGVVYFEALSRRLLGLSKTKRPLNGLTGLLVDYM